MTANHPSPHETPRLDLRGGAERAGMSEAAYRDLIVSRYRADLAALYAGCLRADPVKGHVEV